MIKEFNCLDLQEKLSGYYVLEASAGTGKTFAVEQLYVRLLIEKEFAIEIDEILVVTFTKAAAKELKERIHQNIKKIIKVLEDQDKNSQYSYLVPFLDNEEKRQRAIQKLKETLFVFLEEAQIFTIHGFCFRMLYEYAFDAKILFGEFSNEEEPIQKFMVRSVLNQLINDNLLTDGQIQLLVKTYENEKKLFEKATSKALETKERVSAAAMQSDLNQKLAFHEIEINQLIRELLDLPKYFLKKADFLDIQTLSSKALHLQKILEKKRTESNELDELIFYWVPLLHSIQDDRRKKTKEKPLFLEVQKLKQLFLPLLESGCNAIYIFSLFQKYLNERWEAFLKEEGLYTFDFILKEMSLAMQCAEFVDRVQKKYQAVMIDEFQDTDHDQWSIFEHLFVKQKNCSSFFIIGDPKQSIYRFRNADLYSFLKAKEIFGEKGHRILSTNFRSSPPLVKALNKLFDHKKHWLSLPRLNQTLPYIPVSPKEGLREKILNDGKQSLHFFFCQKENAEELLYQRITNEMIDLREKQNLEFHQMAVLVKDRYQAEKVMELLAKKKIPSTNYTYTSYNENMSTQGMRDFFEAILDPMNAMKTSKVWFGPFFNEEEIFDQETFLKFLSDFQNEWAIKRFPGLLEAFKKFKWRGKTLFTRWKKNEKLYEEIEEILELLSMYFQNFSIDDQHLLSFFEWIQEKEYKKNPASEDTLQTGVKILTIHMSKGLEFDVVFPIGASVSLAREKEQGEEARKEIEAEKFRQFYVALTRAKERVYLPVIFFENEQNEKEGSLVQLFFKDLLKKPFILENYLPHFQEWAAEKIVSYEIVEKEVFKIYDDKVLEGQITDFQEEQFRAKSSNEKILSFSSLKHLDGEKTRQQDCLDSSFQYSKEKLPPSQKTGKIFHEIFEEIFRRNLLKKSLKSWESILKKKMSKYGFLEEQKPLIQEIIFSYLTLPLSPFPFSLRDVRYEHLFPECEFLFLQTKDCWIKGYIDLFFIYKDQYFILDWKSNWLGDGKENYEREFLEKEMGQKRYDLQAALYYEALKRSRIGNQDSQDKKFGGVFYIFIRGLSSKGQGIYHFYPKIENIEALLEHERLPNGDEL